MEDMEKLKTNAQKFFQSQDFDALALGIVNFKSGDFESFQLDKANNPSPVYFDLASLTKPLSNSLAFFSAPERVSAEMKLLLNHRGGLPAWGLLPKHGWREIIQSYPVKESETLYSDFSALRFMLEFDKGQGPALRQTAQATWDKEVLFWKDLRPEQRTVQNGFVKGRPNYRAVHDPNAFNLGEFVSHAGLFGTVEGVCRTLLNFENKFELIERMQRDLANNPGHRFVNGWDTVSDPSNTLAGDGCSPQVFGHLGFTGTSIWIDPVKNLGQVLLCNATKIHWYDKSELNKFRKSFGELIWSNPFS